MAVGDLSPWPTGPGSAAALAAAIACLKPEIGEDSDDRVAAIGSTAAALVERYAPDAPQPIKNEAVIRCAGYLRQSDFGGIASETIGPLSREFTVNHSALFRNSGAAALLSPWKVRRAGAIG